MHIMTPLRVLIPLHNQVRQWREFRKKLCRDYAKIIKEVKYEKTLNAYSVLFNGMSEEKLMALLKNEGLQFEKLTV